MVTLRNKGEEPAEGLVLCTYVPKDIFVFADSFSSPEQSISALENLVARLAKKAPNRYKLNLRKKPQQNKDLFVFSNCGEMSFDKSNQFSLTGKLSEETVIEPGKTKIFLPVLDVGFTYPCKTHIVLLLDLLEKEFLFTTDKPTLEPSIKRVSLREDSAEKGNQTLYSVYGKPKEFSIAVLDGGSIHRMSYTLSSH